MRLMRGSSACAVVASRPTGNSATSSASSRRSMTRPMSHTSIPRPALYRSAQARTEYTRWPTVSIPRQGRELSSARRGLQLFVHYSDPLAQVLHELQQDLGVLVHERLQAVPAQHSHRGVVARLRPRRPGLIVEDRHLTDHRARPQAGERDLPAFVVDVNANLPF